MKTWQRPATNTEWDVAFARSKHATFFHSRKWAEVWSKTTDGEIQPAASLVTFEDGKTAVLTLCVRESGSGLVRSYLCSPAGTYGGWLSTHELEQEHANALARCLLSCGRLDWRMSPFEEPKVDTLLSVRKETTSVVDLSSGFDNVRRAWSKGHRAASKQAERAGVTVREADSRDWVDYYALYQDSLRRWGDCARTEHPQALFEALSQHDGEGLRLWVAEADGGVVAGAICLYAHDHVDYWHGAALESAFEKRPVHLLMHEAMRHACDKGARWFDMNPSSGLEGVAAFKKSFGAVEMPAPLVVRRPAWRRLLNWVKGS